GDFESAAKESAATLRVDPARTSLPVALAPDRPTGQPLPVDVPALPDLWWDSAEPFAAWFTRDSQALKHTAPSPSSDVTMPALPYSEEMQVQGAKAPSFNPCLPSKRLSPMNANPPPALPPGYFALALNHPS